MLIRAGKSEMAEEIYNRIGRNSFYNLLRMCFSFPMGFILPPVILRYIGVGGYGVWALIQVLVGYAALMDMGIGSTITKYTAEYNARENRLNIVRMFNTLFVFYLLLSTILFLAILISKDWIIDVLIKTDKIAREDISFALILYAAVLGTNILFKAYPSFLNGLERMDITSKVDILFVICNFIFSIAFLYMGWGIRGLAIASCISSVIRVFIYVLVCAKIAPYLKLNPLFFRFNVLSEVYKFASCGAIGGIASTTHFNAGKLIISYFLSVELLAYYDLGHRFAFFTFTLFGSFITPIMPAVSGVHASLGIEKLKEVFQTTFKYMALIITPAFLFISVLAGRIISIWLGPGYGEAAFVLRFLSIAYLLSIFTGPGGSILTGMGLPHIPLFCTIIAAVTNVTLNLILIGKFGIAGIIISAISTYVTSIIYVFYFVQKKIDVSILNVFLRGLKFPLLTSVGILLILRLISLYLLRNHYVGLASTTILFPIIYILLVYINPEYRTIRDFIRRPFSLLRWLV